MTPTPPPARPWRRWLLLASLGLNLAFVGLFAGAVLRGPPERPVGGPELWSYARALPEPYRDDLRDAMRASRRDWDEPRDRLRRQRGALAEALVAEPFDPEEVAAVLGRELALSSQLAGRGTDLLMAQIVRMTPGERAAYAEALRRNRRHGPPGD
ncbi:MAG TPA: periplasmic heavy metal sensor [Amaricoccus sp.]|uniref:periplasmic heavy metal sensor n=1 Tax=Amaricoccus sp. TaxID=1872485 RepID=UPI002C1E2C33|nr:periplasmic heavy metal sensor [Amaricoccus sp.]HMQ94735.1 periplasmic heavy metal sensor [Amaricoccus sp.]HMR53045.1 periplasmic heavy metal sensor [Amaricoccus sp.]HMT99901.1 periplasmic heavy metal sensor [Amaricoccus sp.]